MSMIVQSPYAGILLPDGNYAYVDKADVEPTLELNDDNYDDNDVIVNDVKKDDIVSKTTNTSTNNTSNDSLQPTTTKNSYIDNVVIVPMWLFGALVVLMIILLIKTLMR